VVRRYELRDREAVRKIVFDCAFMGEPGSIFFDGEKTLTDSLTLYFTDYEPQSSFVCEIEGRVVGCLTGAKDKAMSERVIQEKIVFNLFREALASGVLFKSKNLALFGAMFLSMLKGEFILADFSKEYPATMHINISKKFRSKGIGSSLMSSYLKYLKQEGVLGLHLATMSDEAGQFFSAQGFELLHVGKRSYFKHILHKNIPLYIYGKKL